MGEAWVGVGEAWEGRKWAWVDVSGCGWCVGEAWVGVGVGDTAAGSR